jgi:probable F420-dependent oxidoreductase
MSDQAVSHRSHQRPVRIGVQIQPQHASYERIRDTAAKVENMGADVLLNWDHFFPLSGDPDGLHFESWTMLAAIAEQTSRIELGALVNCNSYRNANLQADMARTIDHISAHDSGVGRFIFGTGSGWFQRDYDEYGYGFGTAGQRLDALSRDRPTIEARRQALNPQPTRKIPILIGGAGEKKTLRIVAQHADIWHSFSDVPTLEHKLDVLREHGSAVNRDISEIEISIAVRDTIAALTTSDADELHAMGATMFTVALYGPEFDTSSVDEWLAWRDSKNA